MLILNNMYRDKFETIMRIKHITKTQLAKALGMQKQNVNSLLSTTDMRKIDAICQILEIDFVQLISDTNTSKFVGDLLTHRIKDVLKEHNITIKEMAYLLNITPSAVSQLLSNPNLTLGQINRFAQCLNVRPEALLITTQTIHGEITCNGVKYTISGKDDILDLLKVI